MTPGAVSAPVRLLVPLVAAFGFVGPGRAASFEKDVRPLLEKYCYECHGNGRHKGDVTLDSDQTLAAIHLNAKKWETVMERVHTQEMPPDDADVLPSKPNAISSVVGSNRNFFMSIRRIPIPAVSRSTG